MSRLFSSSSGSLPSLPLLQETETTGQAPGGSEGGKGVTDVIQHLLELSEQVSGETPQPQPPEPAIVMETAINQDILQVSKGHSLINDPTGNKTPVVDSQGATRSSQTCGT